MDFGEDTGSPVLEDYARQDAVYVCGFSNNLIFNHEIFQ
jgi:hypothetical protein